MLFIRLRQDHPGYARLPVRARAHAHASVARRRLPYTRDGGSGHVQGGGTAPFAKLTALDRDPGILYAFLDLRPAILRWIFQRKLLLYSFLHSPNDLVCPRCCSPCSISSLRISFREGNILYIGLLFDL